MALATADEIRVVALETKMSALEDLIGNKLDFDNRQYFNAKVVEHTPAPEE
jgi:hypothetical protein